MSQPPAYSRAFSFTNFQAQNPTTVLPGSQVDLELNNAKATLDAVLANLALLQRDDGAFKNASIGLDQLKTEVPVGFNAPVVWTTATAYAAGSSTVFNGSGFYRCLIAHTSGVFATDLAALKWQLIVNLAAVPLVNASQIAVTPSGMLTTDAQGSLQALDAGKAATSHTHPSSAISDSTAAGRAFLTAVDVAAQKTLLSLGSLAFLNSVNVTTISANLAFTNPIVGSLLASINDWAPTGWSTAVVVKATASAPVNITGFVATTDGDIKIIQNTGTTLLTIPFESASSSAANRITGPSSPTFFTIPPGNGVPLMYDGTAARWRVLSPIVQAATPTTQKFTSASGTYSSPAGVLWIEVELVGGGSGGNGSGGAGATLGGVGGNTTFSTLTGSGGAAPAAQTTAGVGGAASGGYLNRPGGNGGNGGGASTANPGGMGGASPYGGQGAAGVAGGGAGLAAVANSGSGGGGGGVNTTPNSGGGGASGGFVRAIMTPGSYSYSVGAAGAASSAGASGAVGGAGGSGYIQVIEHYSP